MMVTEREFPNIFRFHCYHDYNGLYSIFSFENYRTGEDFIFVTSHYFNDVNSKERLPSDFPHTYPNTFENIPSNSNTTLSLTSFFICIQCLIYNEIEVTHTPGARCTTTEWEVSL